MSTNQDSGNSEKLSRRDFFRKSFQKTASVVKTSEVGVNGAPKKKILGPRTAMSRRNFVKIASVATVAAGVVLAVGLPKIASDKKEDSTLNYKGKVKPADRNVAALARNKPAGIRATVVAAPGGTPDYFGTTPNYANSPQPTVAVSPTFNSCYTYRF